MPRFEKGHATRACMSKLASGAYVLIYHDAPPNKGGSYNRARLTAWLSDDEGRTWPHKLLLDERGRVCVSRRGAGAGWPPVHHLRSGRYQAGEKAVLVSVVREEDIRAGKLVSKDAKLQIVASQCYAYGNHADLRDEDKVAAAMPAKNKFDLYLLMGQSNMAGRGMIDNEHIVSRVRLLKFSQRHAWAPGTDPLHTDKPAAAGVGLGTSFARAMADADKSITVGLIPCAVGGTPLERWVKGGDLYEQALVRARLAMKDGQLKGILWHQGESDSGSETTARSYAARLAQMIKDLRADLSVGEVPFVAGKLGDFLALTSKDGKPSFWPVVNEQLATLPTLVPKTAVVEATGLQQRRRCHSLRHAIPARVWQTLCPSYAALAKRLSLIPQTFMNARPLFLDPARRGFVFFRRVCDDQAARENGTDLSAHAHARGLAARRQRGGGWH